MKNAVLLTERKAVYGPMAAGLIKAAEGVADVLFYGDDVSEYDKIVVFTNRPAYIPKLNTKARVGWWMCDLRSPEEAPGAGTKIDAVFLCNKKHLAGYAKKFNAQAFYCPQTGFVEPDPKQIAVDWDALFIGRIGGKYHENRKEILDVIRKEYKVRELSAGGPGQMEIDINAQSPTLYYSSPFNISISVPVEGYTSNRFYNILSSGGFCLTNYFPGIEDYWTNHKDLVWFKTADEAVTLMKYYYKYPDEYEAIKKQGRETYFASHTPKHRLLYMLDKLSL